VPSAPFVVPPLLLIVVLVISAVAKLRDPRDTRQVFHKLRLPRFLTTLKAPQLLPYGELAVAAGLLLLPDGWYVVAATAALLLFVAYLVVVVRALGFGYPLMCGCFGQLGLGWITRQTAVRNGVLVGVAAVTWLDSWRGDGVLERLRDLGDGWWWLAAVALAMVTTFFVVRESEPPAYLPPEEGDDDYVARPVAYSVLDGPEGPTSLWALSDVAARMLVFWDPAEEGSEALPERLPTWRALLDPVQVHLVSESEWKPMAALRPDLAADLLGDPEGETRARLGVPVPGAALVGTDRLLAGGPVGGLEEIEELVEAAAEQLRAAAPPG
jgi:hypothetical protein